MAYNPQAPITITLSDIEWGTIRTALLCFAVDERVKGNAKDAEHYLQAYKTLKRAMGMDT